MPGRSAASPARPGSPASTSAVWRAISALMPALEEAERVHVLELGLGPELACVPAGRTETLASQRSEPSSMFTSVTPSWRSVSRSSVSHSRACSAEWRSGSVTISTSGVPPRLKSTIEASEPWMRPDSPTWTSLAASSSRWMRWRRTSPRLPARAERDVVLGDLVALGQVGIEVVLAVEDRARRDLAAERHAHHQPVVDGLGVDHRQRARAGRGRPGRCACSAPRRSSARSRRTSSSAWRAGRGSPAR